MTSTQQNYQAAQKGGFRSSHASSLKGADPERIHSLANMANGECRTVYQRPIRSMLGAAVSRHLALMYFSVVAFDLWPHSSWMRSIGSPASHMSVAPLPFRSRKPNEGMSFSAGTALRARACACLSIADAPS